MARVMMVETKAVMVLLFTSLIKKKLIQLMIVQAIKVKIIGFAFGSVMIRMVNRRTAKFKNKAIKDLAPFFPPISTININKIAARQNNAFMILPSFDLQKRSIYTDRSESLTQFRLHQQGPEPIREKDSWKGCILVENRFSYIK